MSIRASGTIGEPRVKVQRRPSRLRAFVEMVGEEIVGDWRWSIPAPKGHPQSPPLLSLSGRAATAARAADMGRARLCEVYSTATRKEAS